MPAAQCGDSTLQATPVRRRESDRLITCKGDGECDARVIQGFNSACGFRCAPVGNSRGGRDVACSLPGDAFRAFASESRREARTDATCRATEARHPVARE